MKCQVKLVIISYLSSVLPHGVVNIYLVNRKRGKYEILFYHFLILKLYTGMQKSFHTGFERNV